MNRRISLLLKLVLGAAIPATLMVAVPAATGSGSTASLPVPSGLTTFLRTPDEPRHLSATGVAEFTRTPAFAWKHVVGNAYDFQLSTSKQFKAENALIWEGEFAPPAASVPLALPWITGEPASMYWRVRAKVSIGGRVVRYSRWSTPEPFNMRWRARPEPLLPAGPGYVRWTQVDGATGYQVWFQEADTLVSTVTNVADEREYYLDGGLDPSVVHWRVRAMRRLVCPPTTPTSPCTNGKPLNGLPAVSYGPWSRIFESHNPPPNPLNDKFSPPRLIATSAVSDIVSTPETQKPKPHGLVPAITVGGNPTTPGNLWRTYFFTDSDCVNRVFVGYPVVSPAYAPRSAGLATLTEGRHVMADGEIVVPAELEGAQNGPVWNSAALAKIDLWDSNWPRGRYYAVAVPVVAVAVPGGGVAYKDLAHPQDVCVNGLTFGKLSREPSLVRRNARLVPTATGLSLSGRRFTARTRKDAFYGGPLVTWDSASGAVGYDIEWSPTAYPWQPCAQCRQTTFSTSAMLPAKLRDGRWWYRVRGINDSLPGNLKMRWSEPVSVRISSGVIVRRGGQR
jgi:hypothetical protein